MIKKIGGFSFDVVVPSKGRPDGATFKHLEKEKIPYTLVLESGDVDLYKHLSYATACILPESGRGIGYIRNFILKNASRPYALLDDDLRIFYERKQGVGCEPITLRRFLRRMHASLNSNPIMGMVGCKDGTFGIPNRAYTYWTTIAHIVMINPSVLQEKRINYNTSFRTFEDIDILFKLVKKEILFLRVNDLIYFTTPSGVGSHGGIDYSKNMKYRTLQKMVKMYPEWIHDDHYYNGNGQPAYHITWPKRRSSLAARATRS